MSTIGALETCTLLESYSQSDEIGDVSALKFPAPMLDGLSTWATTGFTKNGVVLGVPVPGARVAESSAVAAGTAAQRERNALIVAIASVPSTIVMVVPTTVIEGAPNEIFSVTGAPLMFVKVTPPFSAT